MLLILDASVAIKWFVTEDGCDKAMEILEDLLRNPSNFAVPELFYFELANIFNRLIINPSSGQIELANLVCTFGINRFYMTPELFREIKEFQKLGLSGYDGAYVALAKLLKGTWITFDAKAHAKIAHLKLSQVL